VVLSVLQAALIAALIANIANRRRADAALRTSYAQIRDLAGRLITAQEAEGARIARELHDDVGQRLASFSIAVSAIKRQLTFVGSADIRNELSALQQNTVQLSNDLRLLSHQLHPGVLTQLGLVEALRARCDEIRAEYGIPVAVEAPAELGHVPDDVSLCLYRVAQEALRNVVKHADARTANVSLTRQEGHILMYVSDDGRGFEAKQDRARNGVGLISLEERVRMLQGTLAIESSRGTGTRVSVTIPVGEDDGKTASAAGR
jgi:two-component system sensor histidine kinase UhpB